MIDMTTSIVRPMATGTAQADAPAWMHMIWLVTYLSGISFWFWSLLNIPMSPESLFPTFFSGLGYLLIMGFLGERWKILTPNW